MIKSKKRSIRRAGAALLSAALMSALASMTSFAAKEDKITSIRLELKDSMRPGSAVGEDEELSIETNSDDYTVSEWEIENTGSIWKRGDRPMVTVSVVTEDEKYFSVKKDQVRIKGDEAEVYSAYAEEPQLLLITLKLKPMSERVGNIEDAKLEGKTASWTPAIGAESYDIYLYRDDSATGGKKTTADTTYDFSTAMRKEGEYYFKVRATGGAGVEEGRFVESNSVPIDASGEVKISKKEKKPLNNSTIVPGQWYQNEKGWRYTNTDGTKPVNAWLCIEDKWYYFGADGYMATGWVQTDGQWYYLGPEGDKKTSCLTPDGYILDENGARVWQ